MRDVVILSVLLCLLFGAMLGSRPLSVPDEGRYVEIPREMVASGDYITPRLNGVKYFEKPVLFYWLESLPIRLFGINEFALRVWPALFALFGCLGVYGAGRRLFGRMSGLLAALVLATSLLYYGLSRAIILDMPLTVLMTGALLLFLVGTHEPSGSRRRTLFWASYASAALAMLTKGLIGMVIPAIIIGAWVLLLAEWRLLRSISLLSGMVVFLAIAAPWHILVGRANPEFFNFYFVHEHFLRYLTTVHSRYQPAWFFIPVLAAGLFPWSAFLLQAVHHSLPRTWSERHEHRDALFLFLWAGLVFAFFSASHSKLVPYILPVFPPLALLIGRYFAAAWDSPGLPGVRRGIAAAAIGMVLLGAAFLAIPRLRPDLEFPALGSYPAVFAVVLAATAAATTLLFRAKGLRGAVPAIAVGMSLFLMLLNVPAGRIETQSAKPLADVLKPVLKPGDEVASYNMYYQDLPVYLERRITVVDWCGELEFGMSVEDTSGWMIDDDAFWERWNGRTRMYLFTKRAVYDMLMKNKYNNLYPVAGNRETMLFTNKEMNR